MALLEAGAPWDAIDERGHSAGAYALRDGHTLLLEKLLDAGSCSVLAEVAPAAAPRHGTLTPSTLTLTLALTLTLTLNTNPTVLPLPLTL